MSATSFARFAPRCPVMSRRRAATSPLVMFLVASGIAVALPSFAEGALKPGGITGWQAKSDPPKATPIWPATLKLTIPQPARSEEILFPTSLSEFCLVGLAANDSGGAELWNFAHGTRHGGINGTPAKSIRRALSPDGKYLALAVLDRAMANDVEVWSTESGDKVATITVDDRTLPMTILDFAGPSELITYTFGVQGGKPVRHLRVWDAATGKSLRQFDVEHNLSGDRRYDISPGGRWLVSVAIPNVVIVDLTNGRTAAKIDPPKKSSEGDFVHVDSARFSPDGSEMAVLSEGGKDSVLEVHEMNSGKIVVRHELTAAMKRSLQSPASYKGPSIDFVESPKGFLWYGGAFIERDSGLMVWTYKQGTLEFSHWKRILTPAGLIVSTKVNNERKIEGVEFPRAELEKSLAAYRKNGPAIVKPGEKVKLVVNVGAVRFGTPEEARKSIEEALASRLADDGLEVAPDGGTVIQIDYKEDVGKTLQEFKGGNPIRGGGVATGRSVQSTSAEVKFHWATAGKDKTVFETTMHLDPSHLIARNVEQVTDEVARQKVFEILKLQLASLPLPFYVSTDQSIGSLPLATLSEMAAQQGEPNKKPAPARLPIRRPR